MQSSIHLCDSSPYRRKPPRSPMRITTWPLGHVVALALASGGVAGQLTPINNPDPNLAAGIINWNQAFGVIKNSSTPDVASTPSFTSASASVDKNIGNPTFPAFVLFNQEAFMGGFPAGIHLLFQNGHGPMYVNLTQAISSFATYVRVRTCSVKSETQRKRICEFSGTYRNSLAHQIQADMTIN